MSNSEDLATLEQALGLHFNDKALLQQAFVHRSFLNENPSFHLESNERLEFLGDAILGYVVAEHLYQLLPTASEGRLTRLRAALVRAETLGRVAKRLGLGACLLLGRGEEASGGRKRPILLARSYEALLGAILLDQGLAECRQFILRTLDAEITLVLREKSAKDYKSRLQELTQGQWQTTPTYQTIDASGPDHSKVFTVEVMINDKPAAQGQGKNKQQAEQNAAREALTQLEKAGEHAE